MQIFKTKRLMGRGFTLIEVLVVVTIIAILAAVLFPVTGRVRRHGRVIATQSNINILDAGVERFYNDMGSYPSSKQRPAMKLRSSRIPEPAATDIGAHRLVEALVGIDMLGYSPSGEYRNDNDPVAPEPDPDIKRQGLYVDIEKDNLSLFAPRAVMDYRYDKTYTFADLNISAMGAFGIVRNYNPMFIDESGAPDGCRPILYYKANKREAKIGTIYNAQDNELIAEKDPSGINTKYPSLVGADNDDPENTNLYERGGFEGYIWDPTSTMPDNGFNTPWRDLSARPYNKDTFLLIAAGPDGIYGTDDDICNFQRK